MFYVSYVTNAMGARTNVRRYPQKLFRMDENEHDVWKSEQYVSKNHLRNLIYNFNNGNSLNNVYVEGPSMIVLKDECLRGEIQNRSFETLDPRNVQPQTLAPKL